MKSLNKREKKQKKENFLRISDFKYIQTNHNMLKSHNYQQK